MALPDVSRLLDLPPAGWRALGARLHELDVPTLLTRVGSIGGDVFEPATRALRCRSLRRRDQPADRAVRLFSLRDPVTEDEARTALGSLSLDELVGAGLVVRDGSRVVCPFRLREHAGLLFFADFLSHGGEAVMGGGPLTGALLHAALPGRPIGRALDLGCGAGLVALAFAAHAQAVVASDINPRALVLARVNAALNGKGNIEFRTGDLFAELAGERFDRIVCQPPFFPTPEGAGGATYSHGGPRGDEIVTRLLGELPGHLSAQGRGIVIAELAEIAGAPLVARVRSALPPGTNLLLLESEGPDADAFCIGDTAFSHTDFGPEYEQKVLVQRDHLEQLGIERLRTCLAILELSSGGPDGWTGTLETRDLSDALVDAALVDALVAAHDVVHRGREALLAQKLRLREGTAFAAEQGDRVRVVFLAGGPLPEVQLDRGAHRILEMVHAAPDVQTAARRFTRESSGSRTAAQERFLGAVERMLLAGLLAVC